MYDIGRTVLRLSWGTRIVNFSEFEVNTVEIVTQKKLDLQRLQDRRPVVYEMGQSFRLVDVIIDEYLTPMTIYKVESIRRVTDIMTLTMFYSDGVTQAEQFDVRIDPGVKSFFQGGYRSAQDRLGLVLFEAAGG